MHQDHNEEGIVSPLAPRTRVKQKRYIASPNGQQGLAFWVFPELLSDYPYRFLAAYTECHSAGWIKASDFALKWFLIDVDNLVCFVIDTCQIVISVWRE